MGNSQYYLVSLWSKYCCASVRGLNLPRCVQTRWHSCFIQASKCGCAFGDEWSTRGCSLCDLL